MATWPTTQDAMASIGHTNPDDEAEVERCLAAAIDRLTALCEVDNTGSAPVIADAVHSACVLLTSRLFSRRQSPEGVAGFSDVGAVRISGVDVDVLELIAAHRSWGVA